MATHTTATSAARFWPRSVPDSPRHADRKSSGAFWPSDSGTITMGVSATAVTASAVPALRVRVASRCHSSNMPAVERDAAARSRIASTPSDGPRRPRTHERGSACGVLT